MPHEVITQVEIGASPARVWEVLTDWDAYPAWNPFIRQLRGRLVEGERLALLLQFAEGRTMSFRPTVRTLRPGVELQWRGHLWVPGLLDGDHAFQLEALDGERTLLIQRESFRGLLVPMMWRSLRRQTRRGFMLMNAALKGRIEQYGVGPERA